jgi:hypothetical protein
MGANESCIPRKRPDSFEGTDDAGIEGLRISVDPSTAMSLDPQVKRYTGLAHSHHPTTSPSTTEKSYPGEGGTGGGGGGRAGRGGRRMKCKTQPPPKVSVEVKIPTTGGGGGGGKDDLQLLQRATMPPGSFVTDWSKLSGIPQISEEELEFYDGYIGKGATAAVRKAKYQRTDVAVKLFYDIMPDEDFIQEVSIAGQLRHQNVALVLGYTTSRWIVTQFFERGSLFELLKDRQEWWSPQFVLKLATDIARGMVYIHDKGLIHRDIKTENVLISSLSCDETVVSAVITDFGISRPVSPLMTLQVGTRRKSFFLPSLLPSVHLFTSFLLFFFLLPPTLKSTWPQKYDEDKEEVPIQTKSTCTVLASYSGSYGWEVMRSLIMSLAFIR